MMMRSVHIVVAALLLGAPETSAQDPLESRGAWRIVADGENVALRTQAASAPDTTLALACRKEQRIFAFDIKSPALAAKPQGEDIRIGFKVDDEDQVWLTLATGPNGTIPITHQTAFWIIHGALTRAGAKGVAFTASDTTWQFSLDGFAGLTESLTTRCGFEPPRGTQKGG